MARPRKKKDDVIVVKKYANRRLYDTGRSSYVTLDDLAEMVREGQDFVVQDAKSGEDLTQSVLTQIIVEQEAKGDGEPMLPENFLRQLIQLYGDSVQSLVPSYLEGSMQNFAQQQESLREQLSQSLGQSMIGVGSLEEMNRRGVEMMQQTMQMMTPFNPFAPNETDGQTAASTPSDRAQEIKQKIKDLEDELNTL